MNLDAWKGPLPSGGRNGLLRRAVALAVTNTQETR